MLFADIHLNKEQKEEGVGIFIECELSLYSQPTFYWYQYGIYQSKQF